MFGFHVARLAEGNKVEVLVGFNRRSKMAIGLDMVNRQSLAQLGFTDVAGFTSIVGERSGALANLVPLGASPLAETTALEVPVLRRISCVVITESLCNFGAFFFSFLLSLSRRAALLCSEFQKAEVGTGQSLMSTTGLYCERLATPSTRYGCLVDFASYRAEPSIRSITGGKERLAATFTGMLYLLNTRFEAARLGAIALCGKLSVAELRIFGEGSAALQTMLLFHVDIISQGGA